jgi:hypothetical protein
MWLHLPPSCPSAPVSEALTSPSDACFQRLASSVLWRSKPSPVRSWRQRWQKVGWMQRLSGLTCEPSIADAGVDAWISSLRDSRASHSPSPGSSEAVLTPGISGRPSAGLSTGRDRQSSFLRMFQASSLFDSLTDAPLTKSSDPSYNDWLTEFRQSSLQRRKSVPPTSGNDCLYSDWQTPISQDAKHSGHAPSGTGMAQKLSYQVVSQWPTPMEDNANNAGGPSRTKGHQNGRADLTVAVSLWPTAPTEDSESCGNHPGAVDSLTGAAKLWATPSSRDHKDTDGMATTGTNPDGSERERLDQLPRQVFQFGLPAPQTPQPGPTSSVDTPTSPRPSKRRLNPRFVEWLMGWPLGWTGFAPVAMASSRKPQPTPYSYSSMERGIK